MINRTNPIRNNSPKAKSAPLVRISNRVNKSCKYFPCHTKLEDCTFCYCSFYPCLDNKRGNYVHSQKLNKDIWSCQNCNWIHKREVVDEIFELIRNNKNFLEPQKKINSSKNIG